MHSRIGSVGVKGIGLIAGLGALVILLSAPANAEDIVFNNADGDNLWMNPLNWDTGELPDTSSDARLQTDYANRPIIQDDDEAVTGRFFLGSTDHRAYLEINGGSLESSGTLRMSYNAGEESQLDIFGGELRTPQVGGENMIRVGENSDALFNLHDGNVVTGYFYVHDDGVANIYDGDLFSRWRTRVYDTATLNLFGGTLRLRGTSTPLQLQGTGVLNIEHGVMTFIDGDFTSHVASLIDSGNLQGFGVASTDHVKFDYDITASGRTTVWAIPEPSVLGMLGIGALLTLMARKKRLTP